MIKKLIAFSLVALLALGAAACGQKSESKTDAKTESKTESQAAAQTATEAAASKTESEAATKASASAVVTDGSKVGTLQAVKPQEDFVIKGMVLLSDSGHHDYGTPEQLTDTSFVTSGLHADFYLNEWIGIYTDTDASLFNVYVVENDAQKDYAEVTEQELRTICEEKSFPMLEGATPDKAQHNYLGGLYVNPDYGKPGLYNMFFAKGGNVAYMVQINLNPETMSE